MCGDKSPLERILEGVCVGKVGRLSMAATAGNPLLC